MDKQVGLPELGRHMGYSPMPPLAWFERIWKELGLDVGIIRKRDERIKNDCKEKFIERYKGDPKTGNESVKSELHRAHSCPDEPITVRKMTKAEARQSHNHSF